MKQILLQKTTLVLDTTTQTSPVQIEQIAAPFIQITVTNAASLDTTLTVQATSDVTPGTDDTYQNWVTLTEFTATQITANGSTYWFLPDAMMSMKAIRVVATNATGTGNATVIINGVRW